LRRTPWSTSATRRAATPLVVEGVAAVERGLAHLGQRGIVEDGEEGGEDRLADLALEGGALLVVVLPLALQAMPQRLVEEHAGGLGQEDGGAVERIHHGRLAQADHVLRQLLGGREQGLLVGQLVLGGAVEAAEVLHQQAIGRPPGGVEVQAVDQPLADELGPLGGDDVAGLVVDRQLGLRVEHLGVGLEHGRDPAQAIVPGGAIQLEGNRLVDRPLRLLLGEAAHRLVLDHPGDPVAALLVEQRQRLLVLRVGLQPHSRPQGVQIVVERRHHRRVVPVEIVEVEHLLGRVVGGVVEVVVADAHLDVGLAHVLVAVLEQGSEARRQIVVVVLAHQ
jgi:hypothetical protein